MKTGKCIFAIFILACFLTFASSSQAAMIGDTITATTNYNYVSPATATIGDGIEFVGISDYLKFDFAEGTLTITDGILTGWGGFGNFVFSDFDDVITGVSITSNTGFYGRIIDNFSFTDHSFTLDMSNGGRSVGSVLVFNIATSPVSAPEPATMLLFGLGLLGLAGVRRKFK